MRPDNITMKLSTNALEAESMSKSFAGLSKHLHKKALDGRLEKLSNKDCIAAYAVPLQSSRRNVVVITETNPPKVADVFNAYHAWIPTASSKEGPEQFSWLCSDMNLTSSDQCLYHMEHLREDTRAWTVAGGAAVKYCLSERIEEHCKINFSLQLGLIVIFFCLFKTGVMFAVAFFVSEAPLMTTGDAIASFLARPDPYTKDMCMATKDLIVKHPGRWPSGPAYYSTKLRRWMSSMKTRVYTCVLL
jgi:hypothetical protein